MSDITTRSHVFTRLQRHQVHEVRGDHAQASVGQETPVHEMQGSRQVRTPRTIRKRKRRYDLHPKNQTTPTLTRVPLRTGGIIINAIPTPLPGLNLQLQGGIPLRELTHVYGAPGTGKTTFCLQLAVSLLTKKYDVLWIDCNNSFSLRKLHDLATISDMNYFTLVRIRDWVQFQQVFENITTFVHATTRLVVLDNFTYFYRLCDRSLRHELQEILFDRYLQSFVRLFRKEQRQFAVVIINQIMADFTKEGVRPITQTEFELTCRVHLFFEVEGDPTTSAVRIISIPDPTARDHPSAIPMIRSKITAGGFEVV
jgi:hypothetical protein